MRNADSRIFFRNALLGAVFVLVAVTGAIAQSSGPRNLEELKAETQRRVDRNLTPATGLKSEDAREALANLHSLDRDEWAAAWSAIGERYASSAAAEESSDKAKAQQDYLMAWRYYCALAHSEFARQSKGLPECSRGVPELWALP